MKILSWKTLAVLVALGVAVFFAVRHVQQSNLDRNAYHIAVVSKGLNTDPKNGILRGVRLYVDEVNRNGGVNGRHVLIDVYDDNGEPEESKKRAAEVIDSEALAVIGHRFSAVSAAAGPLYQEAGITAVAAASTSPNVTEGNPWYFRTIFNNNEQGRFLAQYAKGVLGYEVVHVVHGPSGYSSGLAKTFAAAAKQLGIRVVDTHALVPSAANPTRADPLDGARAALQILQRVSDAKKEMVFLSLYPEEARTLIQTLRDEAPGIALLGVNALARKNLPDDFAKLPRERSLPGFYTNGMYVATPMIYDTANERTGRFLDEYIAAYGDEPDWRAAFAFDAAKVILEAIDSTQPSGDADNRKPEREAIRDWIAGLDSAERSVPGVTGDNYFDENGDPVKPISVAQFRNGIMVSAPYQLAYASEAQLNDANAAEFTRYGDRLLRRSNIVYTGIAVDQISDIDAEAEQAEISGEIWFRYRGDIDIGNIVFENAVESVELGEPSVDIRRDDGSRYHKYPFSGTFRMDALPGGKKFGQPLAGLAFRHALLDTSRLIFVEDVIGRGGKQAMSVLAEVEKSGALKANSGWRPQSANLFSSISQVAGHGHPSYLGDADGQLDFSSFN
ncbi:MAG: ABC transporter substrate-binding protein, partial [Gammaproteobacteria bacterium]